MHCIQTMSKVYTQIKYFFYLFVILYSWYNIRDIVFNILYWFICIRSKCEIRNCETFIADSFFIGILTNKTFHTWSHDNLSCEIDELNLQIRMQFMQSSIFRWNTRTIKQMNVRSSYGITPNSGQFINI